MKHYFKPTMITAGLVVLSACASAPDPAQVCTAEWIKPRAQRALIDFKEDTGKLIKNLRKAGEKIQDGKNINPLQMLFITNSLTQLSQSFEKGRGIQDLKTLAQTCNDPDLIKTTMTEFMLDQGVPNQYIHLLNTLESYRNLIETPTQPSPPADT